MNNSIRFHTFSGIIKRAINKSTQTRACTNAAFNQTKPNKLKTTHKYGQPVHSTHPQLIAKDEVTPGVKIVEFQQRRDKLLHSIATYARKLDGNLRKHMIVIPSASKKYMSDKIPYVFRQNTDFLYLSGCLEPNSCLLLTADDDRYTTVLCVQKNDAHAEMWDGPRTGVEHAPGLFGVDKAIGMDDLEKYIELTIRKEHNYSLWYDYMTPEELSVDKIMRNLISETIGKRWESPKRFVQRLRLVKSHAEIHLMQTSCDIASKAIAETIKISKSGISEHQLFAKVDYECRNLGANYLAYPPVVAGGDRATTIHYINNNQIVEDNEMVLMDAGCEYYGYSSDITRTWPINGTFTHAQKVLYEVVLNVQNQLIPLCTNGATIDGLFDSMCMVLGVELQRIGFISKKLSSTDAAKMACRYCPHHVSHYLGMDVHDTPTISRNIPLTSGMIITVEPGVSFLGIQNAKFGIYISERHREIPSEFHGIGIRIEDDVLVTDTEPRVLSNLCPKEMCDIEELRR